MLMPESMHIKPIHNSKEFIETFLHKSVELYIELKSEELVEGPDSIPLKEILKGQLNSLLKILADAGYGTRELRAIGSAIANDLDAYIDKIDIEMTKALGKQNFEDIVASKKALRQASKKCTAAGFTSAVKRSEPAGLFWKKTARFCKAIGLTSLARFCIRTVRASLTHVDKLLKRRTQDLSSKDKTKGN